jgi:methylmalonyl-CoA mutase N-terminal domain/subunit
VPTELSSLTALRTQQILQSETGVTNTVDPLGGSYFLESLTNTMEKEIDRILATIDDMGGIVKAAEKGWIHEAISAAAYKYQWAIESGEMPIVGINCHQIENEKLPIELFSIPETLGIQRKKLQQIRKQRKNTEVKKVLDAVSRCCERNENLMELLVDNVNVFITEGEISKAMKRVYGVWDPPLF